MYKNQEIGKKGEDYACEYLLKNGYEIIERNFNCRQGEIDVIVKDLVKKEIVFVEVKTRTSCLYGRPSEAVNDFKIRHLINSAKYFMYKNKIEKYFIRIDVIEVYICNNKIIINHIKQVL